MKSLLLVLSSLIHDMMRLLPEVQGLDRDLVTIKHRVEHEGDGFLTVALPTICDALDRGLADGRFACPTNFKRVRGGTLPRLFSGLLCKVFDVSGTLLADASPEAVKAIREITRLFKKIDVSGDRQALLDEAAKAEFLRNDDLCIDIQDVDARYRHILDYVCRQVLIHIDTFRPDELECRNGPGAVFEGHSSNSKYKALASYDELLEGHGLDVFYLSKVIDAQGHVTYGTGVGGSSCKLISVAKNTTSRRTITVEPVRLQFVQQGYNHLLRKHIGKCAILGKVLTLDDQGPNQRLATLGSSSGDWATLDLKSASDLLSLDLVKFVFSNRPNLLAGLLSCRSSGVIREDGGEATPLKKYAGMGNATTFPVQSIVFACLAICAVIDGGRISRRRIVEAASKVRVYGDDIIVPSACAESAIHWLETFGLKVNTRKSFWTGRFRESCGVDAFAGVDVTPVYLKSHPDQVTQGDTKAVANFVAASNHLWLRGLYSVATTLSEFVEAGLGRRLPLVHESSSALGWHTRLNAVTIQRWNRRLHRFEYNSVVISSRDRADRLGGRPALLKYFLTSRAKISHLDPILTRKDHLERSTRKFLTKTSRRWLPSW